jgi:hypothetical protein
MERIRRPVYHSTGAKAAGFAWRRPNAASHRDIA